MTKPLSKTEQQRCVSAIGHALATGIELQPHELFEAMSDILVHKRWPVQRHVIDLCALDRRKHGRTTDPGGVDAPPYDRSQATGFGGIDPEAGARAMGDEAAGGDPPERFMPLP